VSPTEFVFIDGIAVGILVADHGQTRFFSATQALQDIEALAFCDVTEAQDLIAQRCRSQLPSEAGPRVGISKRGHANERCAF